MFNPRFYDKRTFDSFSSILNRELKHPITIRRQRHHHIGYKIVLEYFLKSIVNFFFDFLIDDLINKNITFYFPGRENVLQCVTKKSNNYFKNEVDKYALYFYTTNHKLHFTSKMSVYATFLGMSKEKFKRKIESGHIYL